MCIRDRYSPDPGDTIILCSSPIGGNTSTDNVNVSIEFDWFNGDWIVHVSDTGYSGDIAFSVITPETPYHQMHPQSSFNVVEFDSMRSFGVQSVQSIR